MADHDEKTYSLHVNGTEVFFDAGTVEGGTVEGKSFDLCLEEGIWYLDATDETISVTINIPNEVLLTIAKLVLDDSVQEKVKKLS